MLMGEGHMKETIDDTGFGGIRLIQDLKGFRYGIDAVLLADFAEGSCPDAMRAAELGSGNGIISLLLAWQKEGRQVTGIELQEAAASLAERNAVFNELSDRVHFVHCDITDLKTRFPEMQGSCDLVVSNPPYIARGSGIPSDTDSLQAARQETTADLEDFVRTAAWLLRGKGTFCMVHRPSRLVDIFYYCRKYRLEPKRIRFVCPRPGASPNIVLICCVSGGGKELKYDNMFYVYNNQGGYTKELLEIYRKSQKHP